MTQPTSAAEYEKRFMESHKITGYGILETTMHTPCPFCAAPDWSVFPVINTEEAMRKEVTCKECGRSGKFLLSQDLHSKSFEFVQTGGPDAPEWLVPAPRRI